MPGVPFVINKNVMKEIEGLRKASGLPTKERLKQEQELMDNDQKALEEISKELTAMEKMLKDLLDESAMFRELAISVSDARIKLAAAYATAGGRPEGPGDNPDAQRIKTEMDHASSENTKWLAMENEKLQEINLHKVNQMMKLYVDIKMHQTPYRNLIVNNHFEQALTQQVLQKIHDEFLTGGYRHGKAYEEFKAICETGALYAIAQLENRVTPSEETACTQAGWDLTSKKTKSIGFSG